MNTKNLLHKSGPVILAIVLFLVISVIYFSPVLEGKKLQSSDGTQFKGMAKEIVDYREATGKEALWSNTMFSGMPAYLTSTLYPGELFAKVQRAITAVFLYIVYSARYWRMDGFCGQSGLWFYDFHVCGDGDRPFDQSTRFNLYVAHCCRNFICLQEK